MSINVNSSLIYPQLRSYAVLSATGLSTVDTTTITNGVYGVSTGVLSTGTFLGTLDSGNAGAAQTQVQTLRTAIASRVTTLTSSNTLGQVTGSVTLIPNTNYNSGVGLINFTDATIVLDAQGDSSAQFFITAGTSMTFNNISSITLRNGATNCNIFWVAGTKIEFTGTLPSSIPGIFIAGSAITFASSATISGRIYAQTQNISFSGISSVNAICSQIIVCYAKGTLILTKFGFVPIERIKAGHKIVTNGKIYDSKFIENGARSKVEPVKWVSKFKVIDLNSKSRPICIKKNALGKNCPFRNLYISPDHSILINGVMFVAKELVNGRTIYQDNECEDVEYYHLECEDHSVIIANGILSESYLEKNNRDVFDNSIRISNKNSDKKNYLQFVDGDK